MTWTRPALVALGCLFMFLVFVQFFLGGLMIFSGGDGNDLHTGAIGYGALETVPLLMLIVAAIGRMGMKIIGMSVALVIMAGIQPMWASIDTESDWINAIHIPFALAIAFLGYHILVAALRAYRADQTAAA